MEITNINQLDLNKVYTYTDYLLWKFSEKIELLKGRILKMSPAPSRKHQEILRIINRRFDAYFYQQQCNMYFAPFDVRLPKKGETEIYTVVQPDLCVVCDESKLDERGCLGAPDLIVEILSPGNSKKEMKDKFEIYQEAGVREYWMVYPLDEMVLINVLEDGGYHTQNPIVDDWVTSRIFPELKIHTDEIFEQKK
ncbi:Uma2 family endonuclease [Bergeyella porcorum]|uniref:Uma2 family endonuclease n=1 Tax=Bergeyella porcorum TaxID=1735111 RepID=UPI0035ED66A4